MTVSTGVLGEERHRRARLFGLALLVVAESMIFVPLFAIRFLTVGTGQPANLGSVLPVLLTATMVASFVAMYGARRTAQQNRWPSTAAALWTAAVLGLVTAIGAGIGWSDPALNADSSYSGVFYVTTGAHAAHLVLGSAFLAGLAVQARQGRLAGEGRTTLDCAYWFWAFLLVVWVAIDVIFYLV